MVSAHTYVGFGFGAIQAGLTLYEAFISGAFRRLVVAEVLPDVVAAVRQAAGRYCVNIAHADRIERATVGPIAIENPAVPEDRARLIAAIAEAAEIGVAVPSVKFYVSDSPGSLHRILAAGLREKADRRGPRAVVYAAENHNHAAEILAEAVFSEVPSGERPAVHRRVRFLNTVIGKMSGVVTDPVEVRDRGLASITEGLGRAFLVEAFNRILISQVRFPGPRFRRGIAVFQEKPDLLPFEEAKLYGHNATHALAAYLARIAGIARIADLRATAGMMAFLRAAFIEESGAMLIRRHAGVDPLFTPAGYTAYADDLLARMTNPYLGDTAERVGRDPQRKLGWDDRLVGTIRAALQAGVTPRRYAVGAAAALATLHPELLASDAGLAALCAPLWSESAPAQDEVAAVLAQVEAGLQVVRRWRAAGFPMLEGLIGAEPLSATLRSSVASIRATTTD
jgi:mannitol-1-phosphate 5-dehydrogenase